MSQRDLDRFIKKINDLNELLKSLDAIPKRKQLIINCDSHDQVVKLAKQWGFDIGRRWGDD